MEDEDLIARVYPASSISDFVLTAIQASPLYSGPKCQRPQKQVEQVQYGRRDRQPTEEPEQSSAPLSNNDPCIEVRFSRIPQSTHGIIFGRNPKCDVVLPSNVVSNYHFGLTFDDARRLIVKDWGSLLGTQVTYDGEGAGKRREFCWIVSGDLVPRRTEDITVCIVGTIIFRIDAIRHDITTQAYIEKVDRFRRGIATMEHLFSNLDLPQRPGTELATGTHTPGRGTIHLRKTVGQGAFGVVTHFWNVSNGMEFALKEPTEQAIRKRIVDANAWRKEARIMADLSHPHIVQFFGSNFTPHPQLRLEYLPEGSLDDHDNITAVEGVLILRQCLSALKYLHGSDPPVVHRDIKPGNILVKHRSLEYIYVKFSDFGLSKDSYHLSTICGSHGYLAPEICENQEYIIAGGKESRSYSVAVDIWSLGVVVYEIVCRLPQFRYRHLGTVWCEKIVNKLQKDLEMRPDDLKRLLSSAMVVLSPALRGSAQDCYDRALQLSSTAIVDGSETPRQTSHAEEVDRTPSRDRTREHISGVQQTVLWQGSGAPKTTVEDDGSDDEYRQTIRAVNYFADGRGREAGYAGEGTIHSANDRSGLSGEPSTRARSDAPSPQSYASMSGLGQKRPTTKSGGRCRKRVDRDDKDGMPSRQQGASASGGITQESVHAEARSSITWDLSLDTIDDGISEGDAGGGGVDYGLSGNYSEASYRNGSYLAPTNRSYLQILDSEGVKNRVSSADAGAGLPSCLSDGEVNPSLGSRVQENCRCDSLPTCVLLGFCTSSQGSGVSREATGG